MRTMHGIFDVNNDGVISFDDFLMLAQKFGDLGHLSEKEMANFLGALKVLMIKVIWRQLRFKYFRLFGNQTGV